MKKIEYSIYVIFLAFFLFTGAVSAAQNDPREKISKIAERTGGLNSTYSNDNSRYASLIDANSDICFQLSLGESHKQLLNSLAARIIDDGDMVKNIPELKDILENSLVKFFFKTAFDSILKDLSVVSYSCRGGAKEYMINMIFTFNNAGASQKIYETKKDLFEMFFSETNGSAEVKIAEEKSGDLKMVYAMINGKIGNLAMLNIDSHLIFLYTHQPSQDKFIEAAKNSAELIKRFAKNEKNPKFDYDNMLKDFNKSDNFILNADFGNLAIEDTAAAELVKGIFIGAKLDDDFSKLSIDSYVQFRQAKDNKIAKKNEGEAGGEIGRKTLNALRLLFKPFKGASSAVNYLPEDTSLLVEFNLNFGDEFLALTDIFVFRGILLTATGIDYKDDFLSWFDGSLFFAIGKINVAAAAFVDGKPVEMPEMYIGFKSRNAALADKFADKTISAISDNLSPVKAVDISIDKTKARSVKIAEPYFKECEIVFGQAGAYYLIASSKEAFEKSAGRDNQKAGSLLLSETPLFKNNGGYFEGRFFNLYLNYKPVFETLEKFTVIKPELKFITAFPFAQYSSNASMAENQDIKAKSVFVIDTAKFNLIIEKFSVANLIKYFEMLDKLAK